ncbi:MAG: hypothetical protein M3O32_01635 [Actinomycetota bacterium]|nr:hypothetical protein [Actinomycetota bacterium]
MARPQARRLSLHEQAFALRERYPHAPAPRVWRGRLTWTVQLQPTPLSTTYTVRVTSDGIGRPKVLVLDPALEDPWGGGLPHVFPPDELCLYRDEFHVWHDLIAVKMVPWVSEWLYYYELWGLPRLWLTPDL